MTLTEFLMARIAEDEAVARGAADNERYTTDGAEDWAAWAIKGMMRVGMALDSFAHVERWTPARVLAECEARRRIVEDCQRSQALAQHRVIRWLALPYADHSDYQDEWKPAGIAWVGEGGQEVHPAPAHRGGRCDPY